MRKRPGNYVALSDAFPDHSTIAELSDAGFRLYVTLICFCARNLTDGRITTAIVARHAHPSVTDELLEAGVMAKADKGFLIPAYLDWNLSRVEVETRKQHAKEAGSKGGSQKQANRLALATDSAKQTPSKSLPDVDVDVDVDVRTKSALDLGSNQGGSNVTNLTSIVNGGVA